jgi:uncharacterized membrane-anchored protein
VEEGVSVTPIPATLGEVVAVNYDGILAQSGAESVYMHMGYGSNEMWINVQDVVMQKNGATWMCQITPDDARMNFCFHDGANHWDNNYGHNWSIAIHDGDML